MSKENKCIRSTIEGIYISISRQTGYVIFPDAQRVLLTAYADTDAAVRSINKAKIDFYLMKPLVNRTYSIY